MKAKTIEQYHILEWLKKHFVVAHLNIELLNHNHIKITDKNKDTAVIVYGDDGSIFLEKDVYK